MRAFAALLALVATVASAAEKNGAGLEQAAIANAKKAVRYLLKDGDSAKFRNLKSSPKHPTVICGEVNAKNSMGGYGGFRRFISSGKPDTTIMEEAEPNFPNNWQALCMTSEDSAESN